MSTGNTGGMLPSTGWCSLGEQLYPLLLLFEYINSFFNRSLAICVFSRTWCEQAAPYWIPTPRTTGTKSKEQRAGPHICSETLRTTRARWHRMSGKPTWSPSPSSLKTWVSLQTVIELCFSCGEKTITQVFTVSPVYFSSNCGLLGCVEPREGDISSLPGNPGGLPQRARVFCPLPTV